MYGKELILDLHECNSITFTRKEIAEFMIKLCNLISMERCTLHFWDYENQPEEYKLAEDHLKGTSAIQFITTSNITIHTLDVLDKVFINIFTCKDFDPIIASEFCASWFGGIIAQRKVIDRI
jgi:S-adenosylmethionine/arginine decarboxylase-like enzyme